MVTLSFTLNLHLGVIGHSKQSFFGELNPYNVGPTLIVYSFFFSQNLVDYLIAVLVGI